MRRLVFLTATLVALALGSGSAEAAGAPVVLANWVTSVSTTSANMRAEINPNGLATSYHFEYTTEAAYLEHEFSGATKIPSGVEASLAAGEAPVAVVQHPGALSAGTFYRYRVVASNVEGVTFGPTRPLGTDEPPAPFALPDERGWELVSPLEKNGGSIQGVGGNFGGGVIQAAEGGGAITYTSSASFAEPQGAPGASQYLSSRGASGWDTENITLPALSGTYPETPTSGVPYQLFSSDLDSALVSNGRRCRESSSTHCPVENAPLAGSGAPAGYRNYYLRDNGDGTYQAMLVPGDVSSSSLNSSHFEVAVAGATPDLSHVVLTSCAKLTSTATEIAGAEGECDPAEQNLYERSGSTLNLVNVTPGAALAAPGGAISDDGSRVYWTASGNLFLREGSTVTQVDQVQGGGGTFQAASADGSVAFFTKGGHLYRYAAGSATDLTPAGGVLGVLGASADGSYAYYVDGAGLERWHNGNVIAVAPQADPSNYPPATGVARVSPDGTHLAFVSSAELTSYDNRGLDEVYLFDGSAGTLTCASCNPSGELPTGAASLPGASPNGSGPGALDVYKPRALTDGGNRLFFDSFDALVSQDTNKDRDVYEWEADGTGSCAKVDGCIALISNGRGENGATFLDASGDGADSFFLTDASLVPDDPTAADVYDARVGGGFPLPEKPIPCFGDACQPLPPEPEDPTPGTLRTRPSGNLPPPTPKKPLHCRKGQIKRFGKCVKKPRHRRGHR